MTKNILSLTSQEAFDFLMKSEQYCFYYVI
jgi:hypothetical protein